MTTLNLAVAASAGDASEKDDGSGFNAAETVFYGDSNTSAASRRNSGFRLVNVTIAAGSTINTAVAKLYVKNTGDANLQIHCEAADSGDFSTNADVTSRTRTTAYTQWTANVGSWAIKTSPDFAGAVQEVIDGGGWSSGNAVVVLFCGKSDSNHSFWAYSYDGWSENPPKLDIDYTVGGGATTRRYSLTTLGVG